jgi:hypothetical protein
MVATPPQKRVILNTFQDEASPSLRTFVILNLLQDNAPPSPVILKQVQDDDIIGDGTLNYIQHDDLLGLLDGWRFLHMPLRLAA